MSIGVFRPFVFYGISLASWLGFGNGEEEKEVRDKPIKQRSMPCQRHVRAKKELSKSHPVWCVRCGWARRANLIEEYLIKDGIFEQYIEVEKGERTD